MRFRVPALIALTAALALAGCGDKPPVIKSLVGDFAAPGTYALVGDTFTVWKRAQQPGGAWRFYSYSITSGGTVETLEELERIGAPENSEETPDFRELRRSFALPQSEFEAIRKQAALLRPRALGPEDTVRGYAGEAYPIGCSFDPAQPRIAGINFLNGASWGAFVLQAGCTGEGAHAATAAMTQIFDRLERAAGQARPTAR